jgi:hypothetical protein
LKRYFFDFYKSPVGEDGLLKRYGRYTYKAGDVLEKRFLNDGTLCRILYLALDTGIEVPVGEYEDVERRNKVFAYLRGEIKSVELLAEKKSNQAVKPRSGV